MARGGSNIRPRALICLGGTLEYLRELPLPVRRSFGDTLSALQMHEAPVGDIKKLEGFRGAYEIRKSVGDAYRLVYCLPIGDSLYVLHVFKKKSHEGSTTPPEDLALIRQRYKRAQELSRAQSGNG